MAGLAGRSVGRGGRAGFRAGRRAAPEQARSWSQPDTKHTQSSPDSNHSGCADDSHSLNSDASNSGSNGDVTLDANAAYRDLHTARDDRDANTSAAPDADGNCPDQQQRATDRDAAGSPQRRLQPIARHHVQVDRCNIEAG